MEHANTEGFDLERLLRRWFVEYNPLYLISATLCLAGLRMTSMGLVGRANVLGDLAVGAVNELYAFALIGGAALLTRLGQRRPGVMLALLAVLYQGDVMFEVETISYLHTVGLVAAFVWVVSFVVKLRALAWAVRLRPSRSAYALAAYGGFGLAMVPQIVNRLEIATRGSVVALWVFSLVALAIHTSPRIESAVDLDAWGRTVLRRSERSTWALWTALAALHMYFWSTTFPLGLGALVPAACLLSTRALRRESIVWGAVTATLVVVAIVAPHHFSLSALMAAAMLTLRAYRHRRAVVPERSTATAPPFRAGEPVVARQPIAEPTWTWVVTPPTARRRFLVGALFTTYLAAWTLAWSAGPWPRHVLWLDVVLTAIVLAIAWRGRARFAIAPLALTYAHLLVQAHVVTAPRTLLQYGLVSTGAAYALLVASLGLNYWLRERESTPAERDVNAGSTAESGSHVLVDGS